MMSVVNGVRIAGRFDVMQNNDTVLDLKVTRVWKYLFGGREEWEEQLNIYRWMLSQDGFKINKLQIMMILLDWSKFETFRNPDYPKSRAQLIDINLWPLAQTQQYVEDRVNEFLRCKTLADDKLPLCSEEDRWAARPVFKLYRTKTQKNSTKNFESLKRATAYELKCKQNDPKKWAQSHIKSVRGDLWKRCDSWCAVADHCNQYKNRITS
jgi:hypothetical protein